MKFHPIRNMMFALCFWAVAAGSVGAQQQPEAEGTSLGLAFNQVGPVGLRGYLACVGTFMYETAKVENVSAKPISVVTFGVLVADLSNRNSPTLLRSSAVGLSLHPGNKQDVNVRLLPMSQLQDLERSLSTPKVTLGVLAVEWADGTSWVFDLPEGETDFSSGIGRVVEANQR